MSCGQAAECMTLGFGIRSTGWSVAGGHILYWRVEPLLPAGCLTQESGITLRPATTRRVLGGKRIGVAARVTGRAAAAQSAKGSFQTGNAGRAGAQTYRVTRTPIRFASRPIFQHKPPWRGQ